MEARGKGAVMETKSNVANPKHERLERRVLESAADLPLDLLEYWSTHAVESIAFFARAELDRRAEMGVTL